MDASNSTAHRSAPALKRHAISCALQHACVSGHGRLVDATVDAGVGGAGAGVGGLAQRLGSVCVRHREAAAAELNVGCRGVGA
jgi:hypothetical protein